MRKTLLTLIIAVSSSLSIYAQTPNWGWAEPNTNGTCNMDTHGIWASPSGKVYMEGRFGGTLEFTPTTVSAVASGTEVFSAKLDSAGKFHWIKAHPYSGGNDYDYGFGADKHENTYVTGQTQGSNGLFLDKYDSAGHLKYSWAPAALSSGMGGYGNVGVDSWGRAYVTGGYSGTKNFGPNSITSVGSSDLFLAKVDSNGNCRWAISAGAPGQYVGGRGTATDRYGNIYICGSYNGTATFKGTTAFTITLPANSGNDALFIAKYDSTGVPIWVKTATNAGFNNGAYYWQFNAIAVDSTGNAYVTGKYMSTATFGGFSITSTGGKDIFVAKCLANGTWEWAKSAGGSSGDDYGYGIALDKYSDVYITGSFITSANFSGTVVTSAAGGNGDVFVAKYANSTGDLQWVQVASGTSTTNGISVSVDNLGYAYVTGSVGASATFGSKTILGTSCGIYVAKLDTIAPRRIIPTVSTNYCSPQSTTIPYTAIGTFNGTNSFIAELSDASGSFASPTTIGTLINTTTSGSISVTIPSGLSGSNYLIRVVSTNPATSSWASGGRTYNIQSVYPENFYVTINSVLTLNVTPANPTVCNGSSIKLKETNGPAGTTYTWTGSGSGSTGDSAIMNPTTATPVTVTASSGLCTGTTTLTVNVNPLPTVGIGAVPVAVCTGGSTVITATGGTSYSWNNGSTTSSISVSPTSSTFEYVVTDTLAGCYAKDSMTITVNPTPTITASNSVALCSGAMTPLSANGAGLNGTYVWNPIAGLDTAKGPNTKSTPTITTTYTITGRTFVGCADSTMVTVTVNSNPVPSVSTMQAICAGGSTPLSASGGTDYSWAPVTGLSSSTIAAPNASPAASTQYTVTVSNGTCQATDTVTVAVNSLPTLSVAGTATILTGESTPISVSATTGNTYSWSPSSSLSCSTCANPVATPTTTTMYTVTVTNASNCSDTGSVLVTVKEVCGPVYVPNAFSPNGDGSNDALKVMGNCIKGMELTIFDRWGNVVYESTNPNAQWDGTSKGRVLNTGTYVYTLAATDVDNNTINKKGNITLLR